MKRSEASTTTGKIENQKNVDERLPEECGMCHIGVNLIQIKPDEPLRH